MEWKLHIVRNIYTQIITAKRKRELLRHNTNCPNWYLAVGFGGYFWSVLYLEFDATWSEWSANVNQCLTIWVCNLNQSKLYLKITRLKEKASYFAGLKSSDFSSAYPRCCMLGIELFSRSSAFTLLFLAELQKHGCLQLVPLLRLPYCFCLCYQGFLSRLLHFATKSYFVWVSD